MTTPPPIIGFAGYGGAGKDTAAAYLVDGRGYVQRAFADKVRETAQLFGDTVYVDDVRHWTYNAALAQFGYEEAKRRFPKVREYLVKIGHGMRQILGDRLWVDQVFRESDGVGLVISDIRYENEAKEVLGRGGVFFWIERPGVGPANETERENSEVLKRMASFHVDNLEGEQQSLYDQIDRCLRFK